jgi:hypothetical protein
MSRRRPDGTVAAAARAEGAARPAKITPGHAGEWIEVHSPGGGPPRRGRIIEVIGASGHEHYRVRWTDEHESIYYPADGAVIVPPGDDDARQ